jgi:cytochrome c biogenesis protein CcmG/thiol:disulfide interchange protein DsbE
MTDEAPRRSLALLPVLLFAALALFLWWGLYGNPREVPSTMIGRPAPAFTLPPLEGAGVPGFNQAELKGKGVVLVNVFASWCVPCRDEHPLLVELSSRQDLRLYGINNKDKPEDAMRFLTRLGQPYDAIGTDSSGRVSIDWGVYGVPESFIVDNEGIIRFKWIGPMTPESIEKVILPEIEKAKKPAA